MNTASFGNTLDSMSKSTRDRNAALNDITSNLYSHIRAELCLIANSSPDMNYELSLIELFSDKDSEIFKKIGLILQNMSPVHQEPSLTELLRLYNFFLLTIVSKKMIVRNLIL